MITEVTFEIHPLARGDGSAGDRLSLHEGRPRSAAARSCVPAGARRCFVSTTRSKPGAPFAGAAGASEISVARAHRGTRSARRRGARGGAGDRRDRRRPSGRSRTGRELAAPSKRGAGIRDLPQAGHARRHDRGRDDLGQDRRALLGRARRRACRSRTDRRVRAQLAQLSDRHQHLLHVRRQTRSRRGDGAALLPHLGRGDGGDAGCGGHDLAPPRHRPRPSRVAAARARLRLPAARGARNGRSIRSGS